MKEVLARMEMLFRCPPEELEANLHPDFVRYFSHSIAHRTIPQDLAAAKYILRQTGWLGPVLDFGCGYGLTAIAMAGLGVFPVIGVDVSQVKITAAKRASQWLGCSSSVEFRLGTTRLPCEPGSMNGVLMKDTISHLTPNDPILSEIHRVLKPGGTLFIIDDRNALNPRTVLATWMLWRRSEFGDADTTARLGQKKNFCQMRLEYLAAHYPKYGVAQLTSLARQTRGCTYREISEYVEGRDGRLKKPQTLAPCVNPESGVVQERLINPLVLRRQIEAKGFSARLLPSYSPGVYRAALKRFWPLTLPLTGSYCILATKITEAIS